MFLDTIIRGAERRARAVGPREVRIRVRGGYEPSTVVARTGELLRLTFRREDRLACTEEVVFPHFGRSATLPAGEDVTVELLPEEPGEYAFTCGWGMLRGRLVVIGEPAQTRGRDARGEAERHMTDVALERSTRVGRVWGGVLATWGGVVGLVPHVLHHVGPLAGAALLAGVTGRVAFAAIGFVAAIPFLRRLHIRFRTWRAPALALAVFAAAFSLSSFVIGPAISGDDSPAGPGIERGAHDAHH